ncbi:MAG: alkaline phosphatase [Sedimentisphaerales bacterium]|nr:alkaline phosphatase [Sedimentisphaerales bacterium]
MSRRAAAAVIIATAILIVAVIPVNLASAAAPPSPKIDANDLSFYQAPITTAPYPLTDSNKVRNVILCIGDGMGLSQIALASMKAGGLTGRLCMERMPVTGLVRTHSASSRVTDSAAAATALACGIKTDNGVVGIAPNGNVYQTILEAAKAKGMATGLVATSTITHATPACFASHVNSRSTQAAIAEQLIASRVNVLFGGGRKYFLPKSDPNSARKDDRDLIAEARQAGYMYVTNASELRSIHYPYILGLFQLDALTTAQDEPCLASLTRKAIQVLRRVRSSSSRGSAGFFLMVEGSQIDWACHANDPKRTIRQTLLFDQAIQVAVDFAMRDRRTLVIVTADHETGGLVLLESSKNSPDPAVHWATKGHSASPVPIGAVGPGAALFAGVQDNTDIAKKIARLLNVTTFPRLVE